MMTIYLHGSLRRFGARFDLHVADAAEAVRALCSQLDGFRKALQDGHFKLRYGSRIILPEEIESAMYEKGRETLHITPVVMGAGGKNGGVFQAVLGVVLIAVAWWSPAGWGLSASAFSSIGMMGASLLLGGVSQMLTKMPAVNEREAGKTLQSSAFSGLQNMAANGQPIPLIYGEMLVGSLVISQGITSYSIQSGGSIGFAPAGKASTSFNWVRRDNGQQHSATAQPTGATGTVNQPVKRVKNIIKKSF